MLVLNNRGMRGKNRCSHKKTDDRALLHYLDKKMIFSEADKGFQIKKFMKNLRK